MKNPKAKLRSQADQLWFHKYLQQTCELCGKPAIQLHHFYTKNLYGHLRYNKDNGISLCKSCHFSLHHKDPTLTQNIIDKRGQNWYNNLKEKAKNPPKYYKISIRWYREIIDKLTNTNDTGIPKFYENTK